MTFTLFFLRTMQKIFLLKSMTYISHVIEAQLILTKNQF